MEKPLSILLVEDEPLECKSFVQYIDTLEDVLLVGVTNNAEKALDYVGDCLPDVIILDLELHKGSGNGINFLMDLHRTPPPIFTYILVTTNNISRITHEQARQLGADFVMLKSQADYSAENVIEFLRALKGMIHESRKKSMASNRADILSPYEAKKKLSTLAVREIDIIGISPKAIGRNYLIDAILLVVEGQTQNINSIIAQKYNKTDASVERAMQNAINRAWRTSDIEDLQKYYTARITSEKGVPTLTEFIFYFANKIKTKY